MRSYSREADSEDGLLSFETISEALQERTGHKVWGGSTLIYSTMAARAEGSASDHLLGRGCVFNRQCLSTLDLPESVKQSSNYVAAEEKPLFNCFVFA